jgi:hypothetical protein
LSGALVYDLTGLAMIALLIICVPIAALVMPVLPLFTRGVAS